MTWKVGKTYKTKGGWNAFISKKRHLIENCSIAGYSGHFIKTEMVLEKKVMDKVSYTVRHYSRNGAATLDPAMRCLFNDFYDHNEEGELIFGDKRELPPVINLPWDLTKEEVEKVYEEKNKSRDDATVACQAHNLEVVGSIPTPATWGWWRGWTRDRKDSVVEIG